jgi:hypothetical protein
MDPAEAYRTFNLSPGAPEAQVRAVHRDMTQAWHPDRFRNDPAMYQQAVAATQRLNAALAAIAALGFPLYQQPWQQQPPQQPMYPAPPQQQQAYPPPPQHVQQQPPMYPPPQGGPNLPPMNPSVHKKHPGALIGGGLLLFFIGLGITVGTRDAAESSGGGTYVVAYGPMVWGGLMFFKGLFQLGSKS